MGILDTVILPKEKKKTLPKTGDALSSIILPGEATTQQQVIAKAYGEAQVAERTAKETSSLSGMLKNSLPKPVKSFVQGFTEGASQMPTPEKKLSNLYTTGGVKEGAKVFADTVNESLVRFERFGQTINDPGASLLKKGVKGGEAVLGGVNILFAPIVGGMTTLASYPVIGYAAESFNRLFAGIGGGASKVAIDDVVANLPVSQKTKDTIAPLVGEIASLAAQAMAGKIGADGVALLKQKTKILTESYKNDVSRQLKILEDSETRNIPIKTPTTKHKAYADEMGYEPYMPIEKLPIIEFGSKARSKLPSIQIGRPTSLVEKMGSLRVEPIRAQSPIVQSITQQRVITPQAVEPVKMSPIDRLLSVRGEPERIRPVESTGVLKTPKLAESLEKRAMELESVARQAIPETAGFRQANMREQARIAESIIQSDYNQALRIALGKEAPPPGLLANMMVVAVEKLASERGDIRTLRRLATESTRPIEASAMGQEIRALGERQPDSPVKIMSDIVKAREEAFTKKNKKQYRKAKEEVIKDIEKEMKPPTKRDWDNFINQIKCGY